MGYITAILAAGSRDNTVIRTSLAAKFITKRHKLFFPFLPIYRIIFIFGKTASIADTLGVKVDCFFFGILGIFYFHGRIGALIGNHAFFAKLHFRWEPVFSVFLIHMVK